MIDSKKLYEILYQNDTLFKVDEPVLQVTTKHTGSHDQVSIEIVSDKLASEAQSTTLETKSVLPIQKNIPAPKHTVLVLTNNASSENLPQNERELLAKILKSVQVDIESADIFNFNSFDTFDTKQILSNQKTQFLIIFDVSFSKLKLDFQLLPYTPKNIGGVWVLYADALAQIEQNIEAKKKLWTALKQMFQS